MFYIVWETEINEYNTFIGVASTKEKANRLIKRAFKTMKKKDYVPDEFSLSNFEIEKMKNGQIHEGALEGY